MKILHLDSGRDWRGGQQQVAYLVRGLLNAGAQQHLIVRQSERVEARLRSLPVARSTLPFKSEWDIRSILRLAGVIRRFQPDIVHAHDSRTLGQAAVLRGLGRFSHLVGSRRVAFPIQGNPLWRWKYQRSPDKIIAVSRYVQDSLLAAGVSSNKIAVVYDGLEIPPLPEMDEWKIVRRCLGIEDNEWVIGAVGQFTSEKGHEVLLRGFRRILQDCPDARLVLVGDGPLEARYLDLIRELALGEKVILVGNRPDLVDILPAFDLFVLPSLQEGLGSILLLAMALQVPVCASQTGGIPELVADKVTGFLFRPGDPSHLVSVVLEAMRSSDLRRVCASNARNRVLSQFSAERMVAETLEIYINVLGS